MISIPLYIFLFGYILFLAIFAAFMLVILYHIVSTASFTMASFFVSFFVLASTVLVIYFTATLLSEANIDWRQAVPLFSLEWISGLFGSVPDSSF